MQSEHRVITCCNVLKLPGHAAIRRPCRVAIPADSPAVVAVDEINLGNSRSKTVIGQKHFLPGPAAIRRAITETAKAQDPSVIRVRKINRMSSVREYRRPVRAAVGGAKQTFRATQMVSRNVAEVVGDKFHVTDEKILRHIWIAD
jgi:hypothetical protein